MMQLFLLNGKKIKKIKRGPSLSAAMSAQLPQPLPPHPQIWLEGEKNRGRVGAEEGEEGGRQDSEGGGCFVYVLAMKKDDYSSFKTGDLTAEHERTEALLRCLVKGEGGIQ